MRAAVELARDGHDVVLLERADALGGQLLQARRVPGRETVDLLLGDLTRDLETLGVDVRLGVEATPDVVASMGADEVVIATGAVGVDVSSAVGRRVVVVDGDGTSYASGVVLSLLADARDVEVVTAFESLFPHVGSGYDRPLLLERLACSGSFRRRVQHVVESRAAGQVTVRDTLTGEREVLREVDSVLVVEPREPVLPAGLSGHVIGDALAPRDIDAAIFDAVELAYGSVE
jgi:hypothetical protein